MWFDTKSGQLVRAAYLFSVPVDIWAVATEDDPKSMDDVPIWVKPMITPMKAEVSAIAVEYGLHEGRFWLPRLRLAEGSAQVSFMHVPFKMEESFKYASVNGKDSLPPIKIAETPARSSTRLSGLNSCGELGLFSSSWPGSYEGSSVKALFHLMRLVIGLIDDGDD